jgi:hypothetical protein
MMSPLFSDLLLPQQMSLICLLLFFVIGSFDGIYFHLYKYRLHEHRESRFEHGIHTLRAFVFAPIAVIFYVFNASGKILWLGIGLLVLDLFLESIDVLVEKKARQNLGGISSAESAIHILATGFKTASLAFILSVKPLSAWSIQESFVSQSVTLQPGFVSIIGVGFATVMFFAGLSHLYLLVFGMAAENRRDGVIASFWLSSSKFLSRLHIFAIVFLLLIAGDARAKAADLSKVLGREFLGRSLHRS